MAFAGIGTDYPFNYLRSDILPGDGVLVKRDDGQVRQGVVSRITYLDWDCSGFVACKTSEAEMGPHGLVIPPGYPIVKGLVDIRTMADHLRAQGWTPLKTSNIWKIAYALQSGADRANILLRRRGVDLQILPGWTHPLPPSMGAIDTSPSQGRIVRHFLSQTTFNLYEGVARFAEAFENGAGDYDRFFRPVGSRKRRTPELMDRIGQDRSGSFDRDLYEALGGDGGPVYLGDGLSIGASGSWHDD